MRGTGTVSGGQDGIARPDAQGCLTVELAHGQSVTLKGSLQRDKGIAYTVTQQQVRAMRWLPSRRRRAAQKRSAHPPG